MTASNEIKTITPTLLATAMGIMVDGGAGVVLAGLTASLDLLISQRKTEIDNKRINELLENVANNLASLDESQLNKDFLASDEFFDIFQRCREITTRAASDKKRKLVADYLSGVIQSATIDNIHEQLLEDLNALQEFHLQVIAALSNESNPWIRRKQPPAALHEMDEYIYIKAISDLERLGFLESRAVFVGEEGELRFTTDYLVKFKETFKSQ